MQQVDIAQLLPLEFGHREHLAQFSRREWQEWFERNTQISSDLESKMQDSRRALHVRLSHLPRFGIREVLITNAREVHGLLLRIAEAEVVQQFLHLCLHILELRNSGLVIFIELTRSR